MVPLSSDVLTDVPVACIYDEMDCECVGSGNLLEELSLVGPSSAVLDVPLCANLRRMQIYGAHSDRQSMNCSVYETVCDTPAHVIVVHSRSYTESFLPFPSTVNSDTSHPTDSEDALLYVDLGDCNQECRGCECLFWLGERLKVHPYEGHPEYHSCCGGGKIYIPPGALSSSIYPTAFRESSFYGSYTGI